MDKFKPELNTDDQDIEPIKIYKKIPNKNDLKQYNNFKDISYEINELIWYKLHESNWVIAQVVKRNSNYTYYVK